MTVEMRAGDAVMLMAVAIAFEVIMTFRTVTQSVEATNNGKGREGRGRDEVSCPPHL
jgi:hypothetical protein